MSRELIFDNIQNRTVKNKFLLTDAFSSEHFSGTDTKTEYEKNLVIQPRDWYYRNNPVKYTLNSWGYRTKEFEKIDWGNSIVLFGDSHVFGVGVDDKDTISSQLESMTGIPVVNMGVGGTSMCYALNNSSILRDGYSTPRAVVYIWTNYDRTTFYRKKNLTSCGPWNVEYFPYMKEWSSDKYHAVTNALFISKISKWLWKDTRHVEASYFKDTAKLLKCHYIEPMDKARDVLHAGKGTHHKAATYIAKTLQL